MERTVAFMDRTTLNGVDNSALWGEFVSNASKALVGSSILDSWFDGVVEGDCNLASSFLDFACLF